MLKDRLALLPLLLLLSGCDATGPTAPPVPVASAPFQGFLLPSAQDPRLPAPGAEAAAAAPEDRALVSRGAGHAATQAGDPAVFWNRLTTELGLAHRLPPPLLARAYALVQVGIFDALLAGRGERRGPLPANAVAAGAAYEVLLYLFPGDAGRVRDAAAAEAGLGRGPVLAGWVLGRAVGRLAVLRGKRDGSDAVFTGTIPVGPGLWTGTIPVLPLCGTWKCWLIRSGEEFQPEPPYPYGSPDDLREVQEVYEASLHRTPEQIAIVHKWADLPPPTIWNEILNERLEAGGGDALASARAHTWLNAAMADAFVSCWKTKYVYWVARPFQRFPGLVTVIPTPNFPSYTSGHSTISGAAARVMGELFPSESGWFEAQAEEAALSRFVGGIHFHHDDNAGLEVGRRIGDRAVAMMRSGDRLPLVASR